MSKSISPMRRMVWAMRRERLLKAPTAATWPDAYFKNGDYGEWGPLLDAMAKPMRYMVYCEFELPPKEN